MFKKKTHQFLSAEFAQRVVKIKDVEGCILYRMFFSDVSLQVNPIQPFFNEALFNNEQYSSDSLCLHVLGSHYYMHWVHLEGNGTVRQT